MTSQDSRHNRPTMPSVTISYLSETQMEEVRKYLGKLPNKPHDVRGESLGNYVEVNVANTLIPIDTFTAIKSSPLYYGVTFSVPYDSSQPSERKKVIDGLVSLIGSFMLGIKK